LKTLLERQGESKAQDFLTTRFSYMYHYSCNLQVFHSIINAILYLLHGFELCKK